MERFTITVTKEELDAIAQLIDAGVRANGLAAVKNAAHIIQLLEKAELITEKVEE